MDSFDLKYFLALCLTWFLIVGSVLLISKFEDKKQCNKQFDSDKSKLIKMSGINCRCDVVPKEKIKIINQSHRTRTVGAFETYDFNQPSSDLDKACSDAIDEMTRLSLQKSKDGLNEQERIVMDHLISAWNEYCKLKTTHPSTTADFADGIHKCQDQLFFRIVQRDYPEAYPIKTERL